MLATLLRNFIYGLLRLRYQVEIKGLDEVFLKGRQKIIFLPNHPSMIDPVLVGAVLFPRFHPSILADSDQTGRPVIRDLVRLFNIIALPDLGQHGAGRRKEVRAALNECADRLNAGGNLLFYPSGRLYRTRLENIGANSGLSAILARAPDTRVVLVRTTGLWGSRFGFGWDGTYPSLRDATLKAVRGLLASGLFFMPRRKVTLTFVEPEALPKTGGRSALNRFLDDFYNADAPPNTYVPYSPWEGGGPRTKPEPEVRHGSMADAHIPAVVRSQVYERLSHVTGVPVEKIRDDMEFARDLGLDSLLLVELATWVEEEYGYQAGDAAAFATVGDLLLLASGTAVTQPVNLHPVPEKWFHLPAGRERATVKDGDTLIQAFLASARRRGADTPFAADQTSGVKTYRDLITSLLVLKHEIAKFPEPRIGILLPASVACTTVLLACQAAGKVPVMLNWTAGVRNMKYATDLLGVRRVLTSARVVERVKGMLGELGEFEQMLVLLENFREQITTGAKLGAALRARLGLWGALDRAPVDPTAAILLTSGSETMPKAVPLTHANLLSNIRDLLNHSICINTDDVVLGILPPFHSFGLIGGITLPLAGGVRVVYHPNPMDGLAIAKTISAYKATLALATPTFLRGIMRVARKEDLEPLRLSVVGAEKCPPELWDTVAKHWPHLKLIEGYGVTECSPVICVNDENDLRPGTLGKVCRSMEYTLKHPETDASVERGQPGILLVRGPNVFGGYIHFDGPSPFVEFQGKTWYSTGDLVSEVEPGLLTFVGRLKRFIKLGGEMISLPAIENVLSAAFTPPDAGAPVLAVEAGGTEHEAEVVLFTTLNLARDQVNEKLRAAGLSGLHHVRRVEKIEAIPLLGSGKTDYRALKALARGTKAPPA